MILKAERHWKSRIYERCLKEIMGKAAAKTIHKRMEVICAVLNENLPYCFWVGFYLPKKDLLELGPSEGPPACAQIPLTGVCGKAAATRSTVIVADVSKFPGHVVCDPRSRSEIALPVFDRTGRLNAVFDVDSRELGSFDQTDQEWLEKILGDVFS